MKRILLALTLTLACLAHSALAAISVGPGGSGTLTFDALPVAGDWSTITNTGGSADITSDATMDAAVVTNVASGIIYPLASSGTTAPSISSASIPRWNSALLAVQTVATSAGYVSLMATLRNDTGASQDTLNFSYDLTEVHLAIAPNVVVEEVPGHRVYYSLSGDANSWQVIPSVSSIGTSGTLIGNVNVSAWPNGSPLYLLWADDNAAADRNNTNNEEGGYLIDNITFVAGTISKAISVGPGGSGSQTLGAYPNVLSGWSTIVNTGGSGDILDGDALDAMVQTNVASAMTMQLGNSPTVAASISSSGIARWNTALNVIQTVTSGVGYVSLLATLQNDTGADQSALTITYDLGELNAPTTTVVEEVPGHHVYYSLTGEANSWQKIPEFSSGDAPGTLVANLSLGSWPGGSLLYVLWADDNAAANRDNAGDEEGGYTLDNLAFTPGTVRGTIIGSPTNGQTFPFGVPIPINALAVLPGMVTAVDFYDGVNLIGSDTIAPFGVSFAGATLGAHSLTAVASDDLGNFSTSPAVSITIVPNNPPTVTFSEPANGTNFPVGVNVINRVTASDPDGSVAMVEFYVDGGLFFTDATSPFSFDLCDLTAGAHTISAVAVDNGNNRGTNTVTITGNNPAGLSVILPNGSVWKYLDDGSDQGIFWSQLGFDDTVWASGVAELGYGDIAGNRPERTVVSFGPDAAAKYPTTYFRTTISIPDPSDFGNLIIRLLRDDSGIVYINGNEVFRSGLAEGPIGFTDLAAAAAGDDGTVYQVTNASPSLLIPGDNVIAAEIHQDSATSSDISFDLMIWGEGPALTITPLDATQADVAWPISFTSFVLEAKMELDSTAWTTVSGDVPDASFHHVTVNTTTGNRFYRLRKP